MNFKKWLLENSGPPQGLEPPKQDPGKEAEYNLKKYRTSAFPYYDSEPLPGNKKRMKKR